MREKVVITGMGIVSPIGIGKDDFYKALSEGKSGIKEITGFKTETSSKMFGGEIIAFDATFYLGKKGLRHMTRGTKTLLSASRLALSESPDNRRGIIIGTTLGIFDAISEFTRESIREGWRGVNPMQFPNCVINAPAGHLAIKEKAEGLNLTVSTGHASALDALGMTLHYLEADRARSIITGGMSELGPCIYLMFKKAGFLCDAPEDFTPLGENRSGILLGEGSVVFHMQKKDNAEKSFLGNVEGYGTAFDMESAQYKYDPEARAAIRSIKLALEDAGIEAKDIDFVSSGLSGSPEGDAMELRAIKEVFGEDIPIIAIKALTGETFDAGGAFQTAAAIYVFENQSYPEKCTLKVPSKEKYRQPRRALITSFGFNGHNSALVIKI